MSDFHHRCLVIGMFACALWLGLSRDFYPGAAQAVAAAEEGDEGDAAVAEKADAPPFEKPTAFMWVVRTSGWIGGGLLLISIYFVALVTQLFLELRPDVVTPLGLTQEWETMLAKKDYRGIYKSAKENPSELGQLVATGMVALPGGLSEARDAMDRHGEAIAVDMEKRISMLAVIGTLGPMIGLLGTLKGMIASFSVIAMSETQLKASEVAGGISEALLITFEGVALSVPAIYFFAVFKNKVSSLGVQALNIADEFIRRVHASHARQPVA